MKKIPYKSILKTFSLILSWIILLRISKSVRVYEFVIFLSSMFIHEIFHLICGKFLGMEADFSGVGVFGFRIDFEGDGNLYDRLMFFSGGIIGNLFVASTAVLFSYKMGNDMGLFVKYNLLMALINLIPAYPLDGGRIAEGILSLFCEKLRAVKVMGMVGVMLGCVMFVFGIFLFLFYTDNLLLPVLGIFLIYNSEREVDLIRTEYVREILGNMNYTDH